MRFLPSFTREQKEVLGLLQIGTFLEYFDMMLYIHMAVLLNELFFPQSDPQTAALLAAFAFCSTFVVRPLGALIFGWLGDNVGRKATIIVTTGMMSISCILMANLPTYAQVGITATWVITFCRIAQGMSSMGEIVGAQIYIAESIPRPLSYPAAASMGVFAVIGSTFAVAIAFLVMSLSMNWRIAFWIGTVIALVGAVARTRLRETPEFLKLKRQQIKKGIQKEWGETIREKPIWDNPSKVKTLACCFLIYCGWPLAFYLSFMYFNPLLKESFGYSPQMIIRHNFFLSLLSIFALSFWAILSYSLHPIKILKIRGSVFLLLMIAFPFLIMNADSALQIFAMQALVVIFTLGSLPAEAVLFYHLPVWRRFTYGSFLYALAYALIYLTTSVGLVYLVNYFGHGGLWLISLPISLAYLYGAHHFEILERQLGTFDVNNPFLKVEPLKKLRSRT